MKELDEIDRLFQTTLEGFESTPDPSVKQNIDHAIASKKKRRRFLFIWFPVLFGTTLLAAILYVRPDSKQHFVAKEVQQVPTVQSDQKVQKVQKVQKDQKDQTVSEFSGAADQQVQPIQRDQRVRFNQTINNSSFTAKNTRSHGKGNFRPGAASATSITQTKDPEKQKPEMIANLPVQQADPAPKPAEANTAENSRDSLTAASKDFTHADHTASTDDPGPLPEVKKTHQKWSVSLITGWENESQRPAERFDSLNLSLISKEFARIQGTSFYGKIEFNRRITTRMDAIVGLGFHAGRITQHGSVHSLDSFPTTEGVGSTIPNSYAYFVRQQNESRVYQVHSIILPLGIAYSAPLGNVFRFRISGGAQLACSWMTEKQSSATLTRPEFHSFGLNAWLRPEIHYNFGNVQLFGFGTFNQPLVRQLNWNLDVKRNPAFGAGIGVLIRL